LQSVLAVSERETTRSKIVGMISFVREKFVAGRSAANAPAAVAAVDLRDDSWTDGQTDARSCSASQM